MADDGTHADAVKRIALARQAIIDIFDACPDSQEAAHETLAFVYSLLGEIVIGNDNPVETAAGLLMTMQDVMVKSVEEHALHIGHAKFHVGGGSAARKARLESSLHEIVKGKTDGEAPNG